MGGQIAGLVGHERRLGGGAGVTETRDGEGIAQSGAGLEAV